MEGNAYVFYHPQFGGLRVVKNDEGLFFCIEDLVAITDIGRDKLFPVLADTEGKVVEIYVEAETKKVPKDFKPRLFFGEFFGNADKVNRNSKLAWRSMTFVDSQVVRDMTIGCSKDPERKLFYKWVKDFIQPVMEDEDRCWCHECVMMKRVCYDPLKKPMDIRYAADGLYINDIRINEHYSSFKQVITIMKQAAKKQLLNAQKVDGAIISEENGTIAFRKAPWNDTEVICEQPKVIPGRMVCSGEKGGDEFDFKPYERTGEKLFEEIFKTKHAVVRTTKRTVQVNYTFSRDLDKQDMLRYLKVEHKELIAGFKEKL